MTDVDLEPVKRESIPTKVRMRNGKEWRLVCVDRIIILPLGCEPGAGKMDLHSAPSGL